MPNEVTGEIDLTHQISPNLSIEIDSTTNKDTSISLDYDIDKNSSIEVSNDTKGKTNITFKSKF